MNVKILCMLAVLSLGLFATPTAFAANAADLLVLEIPAAGVSVSLTDAHMFEPLGDIVTADEIVQNRRLVANAISSEKYMDGFLTVVILFLIF